MTFSYFYIGFESDTKLTEKPEFCDFKYINYNQNIAYRKLSDKILDIILWEFLYPSSISRRRQESCRLGHVG